MINIPELRAAMARHGFTQKALSKEVGVSEQTFRRRLKRGAFGTDEVMKMARLLNISDPCAIFCILSNL